MISYFAVALILLTAIPVPDTAETDLQDVRIGLALSGGAALGFAHIGVLKVLQREGIDVCCIAGNSMGSLVGGIYAAGYSAAEIESIAVNADFSVLFGSRVPFGARHLPERQQNQRYIIGLNHINFVPTLPSGIVPLQNVEFLLMDILSEIEFNTHYNFDSLPIPYRAIAVDLASGELVTLRDGRLEQAIRASIAIPGVFSPETIDTMELVDGGVQQFLPVEPLFDFQPDLIIASTTVHSYGNRNTGGLIDIISRTLDLINICDYQEQLSYADIVIEPDVDPFLSSDFHHARELIAAGETAAEDALPAIKERIKGKRVVATRTAVKDRPLPYVKAIHFNGLNTTRASTISHLVKTKPGMALDFERLHGDMASIYNTGLFSDLNYELIFASPDSVVVILDVEEIPYGFYALGIRYDSSDDLVLGVEAGQGNLWGSGASLRAAFNLGNPNSARLGLTGTRLFAFPFGYRIDVFRGSIERSYYEDGEWLAEYATTYHGGLVEAGYILGRNAFFNIGLTVKEAVYRFPALPTFDSLPSSEWVIGPTFRLEYNTYDDLHMPTKGGAFVINVISSVPRLNADREFAQAEFSVDHYAPLSGRVLIHTGFDLGITIGEPAWDNYFHSGGSDIIGFENAFFTTQNRMSIRLGLEFKILELLDQEDYPVYLQIISDIAAFDRPDELLQSEDIISRLHWGLGLGVRTNTPLGPLQFTAGLPDIGKENPADTGIKYYISLGREFRYTR
ncbi:MAG: patatin-like phospholipase family protein [candidate division WOR-3 bacterium]|nr:MAG: patatin-like phospholipase family protein [candidate division WOR-3 bacterium]